MNSILFTGEDAMCFMLAALPATGDFDAPVKARLAYRAVRAPVGRHAGINPAAVVFGPPGQDVITTPL
ncbi:hypothetical protein [Novosphingobium sp. KACC 22771]|uniref:hypothetical protein n=1 Tax=Novosphingobium sp. KACC 22771 TaxID=3025670 RepID=UPI00236725EC|nr:hypothetical protein [Novosphingobium sp. KACC 22771]WDF73235.1 hypothetical protein PQ467_04110 [Novosphingobium sp. KACC 22771]